MQTKLESLIESIINIIIGIGVSLISQIVIFPIFDINVPFTTSLWISAWFTIISLIRSYIIRRWFNARLHNIAMVIAKASYEA